MAELKRTAHAGTMNRDIDDRLLQPGNIRLGVNLNIGRSEGSDIGTVESILGNVLVNNSDLITGGQCIGSTRDNSSDRIFFFVTNNNDPYEKNIGDHAVYEYNQRTNSIHTLTSGDYLNFHQNYLITGANFIEGLLYWTDNRNEPRKINVDRARADSTYYTTFNSTVMKTAPFRSIGLDSNTLKFSWRQQDVDDGFTSRFLRDRFPRFSYRFIFDDDEVSPIAPWTSYQFCARDLTDGTDNYTWSGVNNDGYIDGLTNTITGATLIANNISDRGIVGAEFLYNDTTTAVIYKLGESRELNGSNQYTFTYRGEEPFVALPEDQGTRVYDAVPRLAQSQEIVGGRLVYGNYVQDYDLPELKYTVDYIESAVPTDGGYQDRRSVKGNRQYEVGIVLTDRLGRQTPVIKSSTGPSNIQVDPYSAESDGPIRHLRIRFDEDNEFPDWAFYYKVVVKCNKAEYYNWTYTFGDDDEIPIIDRNTNKVPRDITEGAAYSGSNVITTSNVSFWHVVDSADNSSVAFNNITTDAAATTVHKVERIEENLESNLSPTAHVSFSLGNADGTTRTGIMEIVPDDAILDIFYETASNNLTQFILNDTIIVDFSNCYVINIATTNDDPCYLEINRIEADFNAPFINLGVKAFVPQENSREIRRFNSIIHSSGLLNTRVGVNAANQFNESEGGITISVDPSDGSIQKLYGEDTQLLIFQEDKVSRSPIDKDFIYSAEGGAVPVTTSSQFLGTIAPYAGEYGISQDPASFAIYGQNKYFSDRNRGAIMRLGQNGLTEISQAGMIDFFRDALARSNKVVGSWDEHSESYNVTIVGTEEYAGFEDTNIATAAQGYFTVSFEEFVNGWSSFKTYNQENGISLNNRYYTFNGGNLWEHNHISANQNSFYGVANSSELEVIFNDNPSAVKEFKTLGYEGNEGWVLDRVETDYESYERDGVSFDEIDVVTATPSVTIEVSNTTVNGFSSQTVSNNVDEIVWYVKVEREEDFEDAGDITVSNEANFVTDKELVDGAIWFTYTINRPQNNFDFTVTISE